MAQTATFLYFRHSSATEDTNFFFPGSCSCKICGYRNEELFCLRLLNGFLFNGFSRPVSFGSRTYDSHLLRLVSCVIALTPETSIERVTGKPSMFSYLMWTHIFKVKKLMVIIKNKTKLSFAKRQIRLRKNFSETVYLFCKMKNHYWQENIKNQHFRLYSNINWCHYCSFFYF